MDGYQHFIRLNSAGEIILGFSTGFSQPQDGDICILEDGPRHFHQVWPEPLLNERGQFRYRWNGERVERSQEELDTEWAALPPAPPTEAQQVQTEIEFLRQRDSQMQDDISVIIEGMVGGV